MKIADPLVQNFLLFCYCDHWISDFQSGLINSKKILKNVKFGLQAYFNMKNMLNGSDRVSEFLNVQNFNKISDFQTILINSKQIPKNIKFGLQVHFNMYNTFNGLDRPLGI